MTGATDGDVDRALAAIGATPLKYHSFGGVSVRPPGADAAAPEPRGSVAPGLPPSGEGTSERYRARAAATVFPLLGLALPEAFQIDVEPVWPVGPPVSDQGMLLDRAVGGLPPMGAAGAGYGAPYAQSSYGVAENDPAQSPAFSMPPWLDPLPPANPLHDLPDMRAAPYIGRDLHQNDPLPWHNSAANVGDPAAPSPDAFPVRRLNSWGGEPSNHDGLHVESPAANAPAPYAPYNPFADVGSKPAAAADQNWRDHGSNGPSGNEVSPGVNDWTISHPTHPPVEPEAPAYAIPDWPMPDLHKADDMTAYEPPRHDAPPEQTGFLDPHHEEPLHVAEPLEFNHHQPAAESSLPELGHTSYDARADSDSHFPPLREAFPPDEFDPYAPSRFQPIDAEPTWHEPPALAPHEIPVAARIPDQPLPHLSPDPAQETGLTPKHQSASVPPPGANRRPLADMFRTLGGGGANS